MKLNRAHEASQLAAEVVEVERQFGISLNTVFALREYVTTLLASVRLKETLAVLDEALRICKERGLDHQATTIQLQQAELLLKVGAFSEAYSSTRLLREYFEAQGLVSYAARASLVMVGALIERVQQAGIDQAKEERAILLEEATSLCKQVAWQARHYNLQEEVYKSHYLLGRLWDLQENSTKATRHYSAAIAQIERILDDLVYDLSPSFLRAAWTVYEDVIAHCLQERQTERAFNYLEQARSMALRQYLNKSSGGEEPKEEQKVSQTNSIIMLRMQRELKDWQETHRDYSLLLSEADSSVSPTVDKEVIKAELNRCEAKLSELFERLSLYQGENALGPRAKKHGKQRAKQVDIVQLRQQLTPDQLLLVYFLYKGKLVIFAVTQAGVTYHEIPNGVEQLERLLPLLHAHLQPGGWPDIQQPPQQAIRRLLNKLHHLLIAPVANLLPPHAGSLTIVPYGPLHKLPFHALYDGGRFLVENFQVNYLPASSILVHLRNRSGQQAHQPTEGSLTGKQPLVFGYSGNGHVQCTLDEAKTLADLLNGRSYLEGEATIARLIEQAPGSPIIHIATHGHSRLDAPNFSYVLLADGQLNALDAFSLDLRECELVTLSGCETGLALTGGGDEQLGLGRAFLAAGAKALVMSLWPVEDTATSELMQLFYKQLLNGESKVQALRAAQCQLLHHSTSNYTHPYFWAAFRLVGDVSPLGLKGQDLVLPASKVGR